MTGFLPSPKFSRTTFKNPLRNEHNIHAEVLRDTCIRQENRKGHRDEFVTGIRTNRRRQDNQWIRTHIPVIEIRAELGNITHTPRVSMINPPDEHPSESTSVQVHNRNSIHRTIDGQTCIIIRIRIRAKTEFQKIIQTIRITGIRELFWFASRRLVWRISGCRNYWFSSWIYFNWSRPLASNLLSDTIFFDCSIFWI